MVVVMIGLFSCEDMNDLHDKYLKDGETDYIGRVDSVKTFGGDGRIKIQFWVTDPRATKLNVGWITPRDTNVVVPIPQHSPTDSVEFILGADSKIAEKSYTFNLITESDEGVKSIKTQIFGNVYGERYTSSLTNRRLVSNSVTDYDITLNFGSSVNETDAGILINWTDISGDAKMDTLLNEELETLTKVVAISDVDTSKTVSYQSVYLPEEGAIDMFFASKKIIEF